MGGDFCSACALINSDMMSKLTICCQWENETVRERTGHPPSYAEAKNMMSLTICTHGCLRATHALRPDLLLPTRLVFSEYLHVIEAQKSNSSHHRFFLPGRCIKFATAIASCFCFFPGQRSKFKVLLSECSVRPNA